MATEKEIAALNALLVKVLEVNASSDRVNVELDVNHAGVSVRVSDPVEVLASCAEATGWDWLFYGNPRAYFSTDVFSEGDFIRNCESLTEIVGGFYGYVPREVE